MSYLGNEPRFSQFPSKFFDGDGTAMTVSLDYAPPNEASLLVFISGVRQDTSAYNLSGTSLTFTGTVPSGTANVQVVHLGQLVGGGVPADDSISTVKIQDDAVTADKLADSINAEIAANTAKTGITSGQASAITANTAKVTNATHTGDVTGATALTIADDAVDIAMLSATGTADATTFLRGDNSWAAAGGDNTPAFQAYLSSTITGFPDETWTKVDIDAEDFDDDSVYDHTTNYRFTVPTGEGGKYFLFASVSSENGNNDGEKFQVGLYLNGSRIYEDIDFDNTSDSYGWNSITGQVTAIVTLAAADYVEVYAYTRSQNGGGTPFIYAGTKNTKFLGYKMIGL